MKKLLLIWIIVGISMQTFSYSPGNVKAKPSFDITNDLNGISFNEFLTLTPKRYREITGNKMSLKDKISFSILKAKLKKQLPEEGKPAVRKTDMGLLSLIFGGGAFVIALIPYLGIISFPLAIAAIIFGIIGLNRKKGDTKSIIGLVLGSVFLLLIVALIAAYASGGWF